MKKAILLLLVAAWPASGAAEVKDSSPVGFTIVHEVIVSSARAEAWAAAIDVARWWSSDHTVSGEAERLSIEPRLQGCFCETLGRKAGVVHLAVTAVMPGTSLRMTGGLGPLGLMGVEGNMTWDFADRSEGTSIQLTYAVGGYSASGLDRMAPAVDDALTEALERLQRYIETGDPEPVAVD
ncbi:MAG TPA: SRPBCC family protein [Woeseiaceae bacterium]|nr:SRPBCC family protein [Woeseiaceae bacterium]